MGFDGQDFLTFHLETLTWKVAVPSVQKIKKFWEMQGPSVELVKIFLLETCPVQLQRHLPSLSSPLVTIGTGHRQWVPSVCCPYRALAIIFERG